MTRFPFRKSSNVGSGNPPGFGPEPNGVGETVVAPGGPLQPDYENPVIPVPGGNPIDLTGRPDQSPSTPLQPVRGEPTKPERR